MPPFRFLRAKPPLPAPGIVDRAMPTLPLQSDMAGRVRWCEARQGTPALSSNEATLDRPVLTGLGGG